MLNTVLQSESYFWMSVMKLYDVYSRHIMRYGDEIFIIYEIKISEHNPRIGQERRGQSAVRGIKLLLICMYNISRKMSSTEQQRLQEHEESIAVPHKYEHSALP
jgi:hypothetical protein